MPQRKNNLEPHNELLEQQVLGAMLLDREGLITGMAKCKQKYFHIKKHRTLFHCFQVLFEENIPIDVTTVYEYMRKHNLLEEAGGAVYLSKLSSQISSSANLDIHTRILIEHWIAREVISRGTAAVNKAYDGVADSFDLLEGSIAELESILDELQFLKEEKNFYERLPEIIARIEEEQKSPKDMTIKSQEYPSFNNATGGLRPGNMVAISGAYKRGKTTFGMSLIRDFAVNSKIPVGIISLEMAEYENDLKLLSMQTGTRYAYLRDPAAKNHNGEYLLNYDKLVHLKAVADEKFSQTKIFISDESLDIHQLRSKIKYWVKKQGIKIILVDYIGLVETSKRFERRDLEVSYISRALKLAAKDSEVVVIVLSQENDDGKVAESKGLARDADFWFSIQHPVDENVKYIEIDGKKITPDQSHFTVSFKASRHSQHGGLFLCSYMEDGTFIEIDVSRSDFQKKKEEDDHE